MPLPSRAPMSKRQRPAGPSCRGGASSMLRLAQPASPMLSGWLGRARELETLPWAIAGDEAGVAGLMPSIITPLLPSTALARG